MFRIDIFRFQYTFELNQLERDNLPEKKTQKQLKLKTQFDLQEQKEYWKKHPLNRDYMDRLNEHLRNMFVPIVILQYKKKQMETIQFDVSINLPAPVS